MTGITPEEHERNLAILGGEDTRAIADLLRGWNASYLTAVATGQVPGFPDVPAAIEGPGHTRVAVADVTISGAARETAAQQLVLRAEGETVARQALAALGHTWDGTGGWEITAYATPAGRLGFVNIAHGTAALTSVELRPEVTAALTLPGQDPGPQASGAAAWTAPDVGGARRATAPHGWVQLLADLRGGAWLPPLPGVTACLVTWCLQTCYGRPGEPGITSLAPAPGDTTQPARLWPAAGTTRRAMVECGLGALERIARALATEAGLGDAVDAALGGPGDHRDRAGAAARAIREPDGTRAQLWDDLPPAGQVIRAALGLGEGSLITRALHQAQITRLADACDDGGDFPEYSYTHVIRRSLARILRDRSLPAAQAIADAIPAGREVHLAIVSDGSQVYLDDRSVVAVPLLETIAARVLAPHATQARETIYAMTAIYQADGPAEVDIPLPRPGPWDGAEPVGLAEVAHRLGVERATADKWGFRDNLPPRDWTVGGRPAWRWGTIADWAKRTGRWPWR